MVESYSETSKNVRILRHFPVFLILKSCRNLSQNGRRHLKENSDDVIEARTVLGCSRFSVLGVLLPTCFVLFI